MFTGSKKLVPLSVLHKSCSVTTSLPEIAQAEVKWSMHQHTSLNQAQRDSCVHRATILSQGLRLRFQAKVRVTRTAALAMAWQFPWVRFELSFLTRTLNKRQVDGWCIHEFILDCMAQVGTELCTILCDRTVHTPASNPPREAMLCCEPKRGRVARANAAFRNCCAKTATAANREAALQDSSWHKVFCSS